MRVAKEALELISRQEQDNHHFDIVMIDWLMPGMDGLECLDAISKLPYSRRLKSILITTYGEEGLEDRAKAQGFNYFMEKPTSPNMLKLAIDNVLDTSANNPLDNQSYQHTTSKPESKTNTHSSNQSETIHSETTASEIAQTEIVQVYVPQTITETTSSAMDLVSELAEIETGVNDLENNSITLEYKEIEKKITSENIEANVSKDEIIPEELALEESEEQNFEPIDLQDGLDRCQGNQKLYLKLLGDFVRNFGSIDLTLRELFNQNDLTSLSKQAHTLKGLSANLGAKTLSKAAMMLEKIASIETTDQITCIESFESELSCLLDFLTGYLAEHSQEEAATENLPIFSIEEAQHEVKLLSDMVNEQKMDSYDRAIEMAKRWPDSSQKDLWMTLIEQLDLFDFDGARDSVSQLRQN